jgi:hypothetical protein
LLSRSRAVATVLAGLAPVLGIVSVMAAGIEQDKPRVNADAALSVEFLKGVEAYVELHKKLEATLPPRPEEGTPAQIEAHERALAQLIANSRSRAKQGDLLPQQVRAYFRRQIGGVINGPDGGSMRQAIMEDNPGKVRLRVNGRISDGVPIPTTPAQILGALPKLPPHIEYRFIGERLVLLDVHAQLVVDYMTDALPH